MKDLAVTTSGLYNLSVGKIRAIRFPFPPSAEQARIRERVDLLIAQCRALEARLETATAIQVSVASAATAAMSA